MEVQIKEISPGKWCIQLVTGTALSAGKSVYDSAEEAERIARNTYPNYEVNINR